MNQIFSNGYTNYSLLKISNFSIINFRTEEISQYLADKSYGLPTANESLCTSPTLWSSVPSNPLFLPGNCMFLPPRPIPNTGIYFTEPNWPPNPTSFSGHATTKIEMKHSVDDYPSMSISMNQELFKLNKQRPTVIQQVGQVVPSDSNYSQHLAITQPLVQSTGIHSFASNTQADKNKMKSVVEENPISGISEARPHQQKLKRKKDRYRCLFCNKPFHWYSHWQAHERIHTGERPFKCEECGKAFTRSDGLQCHKLTHVKRKKSSHSFTKSVKHEGDNSFQRKYSGETPTDTNALDEQKQNQPFKCHNCDRSFSSSTALEHHVQGHKGVYDFQFLFDLQLKVPHKLCFR